MEQKIISFKNIYKFYGERQILNNISFDIFKGDFLTVIGGSGSGKTTIIKMINGLIKADKGKIFVNGKDINTENIISLRRKIGYSIQNVALFPHMNVFENISYILNLEKHKDKKQIEIKVDKLLKIMGLELYLKKMYPFQLSGGQKQRVGIARALANDPEIIIMDEPFGAVDEITRTNLQNEILKIHRQFNTTIIFVTHDISEAIKLGNRVLVINEGSLLAIKRPEELLKEQDNSFILKLLSQYKNKNEL